MKNLAFAIAMVSVSTFGHADTVEIPIPSNTVCTADVNVWGYPSGCSCPAPYTYDHTRFVCSAQSEIPVPAGFVCTRDINEWRNPSSCECPVGYNYDEQDFVCRI